MDCADVKDYMVEYIDKNLNDDLREKVASHLDICDDCFNEIKAIDKTAWKLEESVRNIKIPSDFLTGMYEKVLKDYNPKREANKKLLKAGSITGIVIAALLFVFFLVPKNERYRLLDVIDIAMSGKSYSNSYGAFGENLSISSTDRGIKITVVKVAADDIQTLIYFEIQGDENSAYYIQDGDVNIKEKVGSYGFMSYEYSANKQSICLMGLRPIDAENKVLHVKIGKIYKRMIKNGTEDIKADAIVGNWSFDVPFKKFKSRSYLLKSTAEIDGHKMQFKKLTVGLSCTVIDVDCQDRTFLNSIRYDLILKNGSENYRCMYNIPQIDVVTSTATEKLFFRTIYNDRIKDLSIYLGSHTDYMEDKDKTRVYIDFKGNFPMEFYYLGNKITIDNFKKDDDHIQFDIIEPEVRSYMDMSIGINQQDNSKNVLLGSSAYERTIIDEKGKKYDYDDVIKNYETKYKDKLFTAYALKTREEIGGIEKNQKGITISITGHSMIKRFDRTIPLKLYTN